MAMVVPANSDLSNPDSVVRALINILDDSGDERQLHSDTHRAMLNMLDDFASEKIRLDNTQKATMNVLEDFEAATIELQRVNRELQHLDKLKSEFVAMASHELRTPLTSITGFSATMLGRWKSLSEAKKYEFVEIIDTQSQRLMRLVESLLTISRIESGALRTSPSTINVYDAVSQTLRDLNATGFAVVCAPEIVVRADADHFQQVIVNLVSNALRHGAAPFRVEVSADAPTVVVRVIDQGAGVSPEFAPLLFTRFAQADKDHSRSAIGDMGKGAGLGLSIVHALVTAQGGDAWYEPGIPSGACFGVRLPCAPLIECSHPPGPSTA